MSVLTFLSLAGYFFVWATGTLVLCVIAFLLAYAFKDKFVLSVLNGLLSTALIVWYTWWVWKEHLVWSS